MSDISAPPPVQGDETGPVTDDTNTGTVKSPASAKTNTGADVETAPEPTEAKTLQEIADADTDRFFNPGRKA